MHCHDGVEYQLSDEAQKRFDEAHDDLVYELASNHLDEDRSVCIINTNVLLKCAQHVIKMCTACDNYVSLNLIWVGM